MTNYTFWGMDCRTSPTYASGAVGVVIGKSRLLNRTLDTAKRIAGTGAAGSPVGDTNRTDVLTLQDAGVNITTDAIGSRWFLEAAPVPNGYVVEVDKPKGQSPRTGQFGSSGVPKKH